MTTPPSPTPTATSSTALAPVQARPRLDEFTVVDVRAPGEYASGHLPGAHNVPLDRLGRALPALRHAAGRRPLLMVCASGARSAKAVGALADGGIAASRLATLTGGTSAWTAEGYEVDRPETGRATWAMERQVRLAAGSLVLLGLLADLVLPGARWLSAAIGAGLVFSALTDTCGMAALLGRLPHNRRGGRAADLDATLTRLTAD
ncbi:rhodanese-like domain-containing protein [Streptomyces daliensis]